MSITSIRFLRLASIMCESKHFCLLQPAKTKINFRKQIKGFVWNEVMRKRRFQFPIFNCIWLWHGIQSRVFAHRKTDLLLHCIQSMKPRFEFIESLMQTERNMQVYRENRKFIKSWLFHLLTIICIHDNFKIGECAESFMK